VGGGVTGILLGHIPAGTQYQGIEHAFGNARIGCVVFYQPISKASALRVHLPGCYREIVAQIYRSIGLPRELAACSDAARNDMDISLFVNPKRGSSVLQMGFARDQDELTSTPKSIGEAIGEIRSPVVYVDVRLTHPGAQKAIEELRSYGFCMGCLLPGSRHTEAMRMQRIRGAPIAPERIVVPDGSGREILEFVVNDSVETAVARTSP
jgi:hypothetical protein